MATSLAGCGSSTTVRYTGDTKIGDREVKYSLDGPGDVTSTTDAEEGVTVSTVTFTGGKVVVEKARVLVNDKEVAKIADDAKVVEVDYTRQMLTIKADGVKIHEAKFGK